MLALGTKLQAAELMLNKVDTRNKDRSEDGKYLGVLYTGYLDKRNPVTGSYKKRFVVLTHEALHWFKRAEGYDLFGEERGHVVLGHILTTRIIDEDSTAFEVQSTDNNRRLFRASTPAICEEWVSAIRSAIKALNSKRPQAQRRGSISSIRNVIEDSDTENNHDMDVTVLLVSVLSAHNHYEVVVARNPEFGRMITVSSLKPDDRLILSTSNGGSAMLTYDSICMKAEEVGEFDVALQNVPLASSLKLSLTVTDSVHEQRTKQTIQKQISDVVVLLSRDRSLGIGVVLSVMVILTGLRSVSTIASHLILLLLFANALALYNIYQTLEACWAEQAHRMKSSTLRLVIHGHAFTSPDAPVVDTDNEIPKRFLDGCGGDVKEARQRWDITRHWRESEGINNILDEPQPYFFLIKNMYPHFHAGRGKLGHIVYYERPGDFQSSQLAARGVKLEHLVRHWLFTTEYQWQILCGGDETAKSIVVIDLANIKASDMAGDNLTFLKKSIGIANQHYPERSYIIYLINAPFFFSFLWKIVKPMVHENTQKKVRILSSKETLKGLQEHIDISQIPIYYGGQLDYGGGADSCRFNSPEAIALNEYVRKLNDGNSGGGGTTTDESGTITSTRVPFDGVTPTSPAAAGSNNIHSNTAFNTPSSMGTISSLSSLSSTPNLEDGSGRSSGPQPGQDYATAYMGPGPAGPPSNKAPRSSILKRGSALLRNNANNATVSGSNQSDGHTDHDDWSITSATTAPTPVRPGPVNNTDIKATFVISFDRNDTFIELLLSCGDNFKLSPFSVKLQAFYEEVIVVHYSRRDPSMDYLPVLAETTESTSKPDHSEDERIRESLGAVRNI
eukprot:gene8680-9563_t